MLLAICESVPLLPSLLAPCQATRGETSSLTLASRGLHLLPASGHDTRADHSVSPQSYVVSNTGLGAGPPSPAVSTAGHWGDPRVLLAQPFAFWEALWTERFIAVCPCNSPKGFAGPMNLLFIPLDSPGQFEVFFWYFFCLV